MDETRDGWATARDPGDAEPIRFAPPERLEPLVVSFGDLDRARPLPSRTPAGFGGYTPFVPADYAASPKTNGLAIAALVLGLAGIPFFGLVTGPVAILIAAFAIAGIRRTKQKGTGLAVAGLVLGMVDFGLWAALLAYTFTGFGHHMTSIGGLTADVEAIEKMAPAQRRAMRANVLIQVKSGILGSSLGSGIVLGIEGGDAVVLTNRHVVDSDFNGKVGDAKPKVKFVDGVTATGAVTWFAPGKIDLALVRVPCSSATVQPAQWSIDTPMTLGDDVFAVGAPHGLEWTYTQGSLSQFRKKEDEARPVRVLQTSAPINPGNSGGGLYLKSGQLIGINSMVVDKRVGEGLGFAIAFKSFLEMVPAELLPAQPDAAEVAKPQRKDRP